jgi:hypothetical protein
MAPSFGNALDLGPYLTCKGAMRNFVVYLEDKFLRTLLFLFTKGEQLKK